MSAKTLPDVCTAWIHDGRIWVVQMIANYGFEDENPEDCGVVVRPMSPENAQSVVINRSAFFERMRPFPDVDDLCSRIRAVNEHLSARSVAGNRVRESIKHFLDEFGLTKFREFKTAEPQAVIEAERFVKTLEIIFTPGEDEV